MANLILELIGLAREFSQKRSISIYELLQKTDYAKIAAQISENDLYNELVTHPTFISDWLEYSENKRCTTGWYFKINDRSKYVVGFVDNGQGTETEYGDKFKGCANFIKHELDQIIKI